MPRFAERTGARARGEILFICTARTWHLQHDFDGPFRGPQNGDTQDMKPTGFRIAIIAILALGAAILGAAPAQAATTGTVHPVMARSSDSYVSIPSNYVYNPKTTHQKTLHDYCSHSPDQWSRADFRGPCARHDMCYEYKQQSQHGCDNSLGADLAQQCRHAFGWYTPDRYVCEDIAAGYWAAVTVHTYWPW